MLREATLALTRCCTTVSVVARRADQLPGMHPLPGINPLPLDYRDSAALAQALRRAVEERGPVRLAVCWIHSTAPDALQTVAAELGRSGQPCRPPFRTGRSSWGSRSRGSAPAGSPTARSARGCWRRFGTMPSTGWWGWCAPGTGGRRWSHFVASGTKTG